MKKIIGICTLTLTSLFPLNLQADNVKVAVVNVTTLFNSSSYVVNANKTLQANVKSMEEKLLAQKNKIQTLVTSYQKATSESKKKALASQVTTEQSKLASMTQDYQKKVQEEQSAGLQKFTALVQKAVEKIAKEKQINSVLNGTSVIYTDNSWIDITSDVQAEMQKNN